MDTELLCMLRKTILDLRNTTCAHSSVLGPQMAQKMIISPCVCGCIPLNPVLERLGKVNPCEFQVSLVYIMGSRPAEGYISQATPQKVNEREMTLTLEFQARI